jgi:4-alpha-glucanotransferase
VPLEKAAEAFFAANETRSKGYRDFAKLYPEVAEYARFRANGEKRESGWPAWPERERDGRLPASLQTDAATRYHQYAQYQAHLQLRELAESSRSCGVRLYLDLPLGVHPDSYDVWRHRDLFVTGASAGAPPDPFFTKGQEWGFPPMHPVAMRKQRYAYWRKVLQTQLRYAGVLRLDHVMSLHRLYIVPRGLDATQGVYIRYPHDELYAVLTLESARHNAVIVGEDLGTVPAEVRTSMTRHGVKRMFVVQFEATSDGNRPLPEIPQPVVASLNTHDMPPFASYWEGLDAELRQDIGLLDDEGVANAHATRDQTTRAISHMLGARAQLPTEAARRQLLQYLARSRADMLLLNLEDLWLETEPQNVPGTTDQKPNWRRRLKLTLDELRTDANVRDLLTLVNTERRRTYERKDADPR